MNKSSSSGVGSSGSFYSAAAIPPISMGVLFVLEQSGTNIPLPAFMAVLVVTVGVVLWRMRGMLRSLHSGLALAVETDQALRWSDQRFRLAFESTIAGMLMADSDGEIAQVNVTFAKLLGYEAEELIGHSLADLAHPLDADQNLERVVSLAQGLDHSLEFETRYAARDGSAVWVHVALTVVNGENRDSRMIVGHVLDLTDSKELELRLAQTQKMEAIGQLAGGVAHDFNNLLAVIGNYARFVHENQAEGSPDREDVEEIIKASDRGAALVKQLLTFSRRERTEPTVLEINDSLKDLEGLLRGSITESISLNLDLDQNDVHVFADPTQLEQVILNLVVNARDAMPTGGQLGIATSIASIEADEASALGLKTGSYVRISVSDSGVGMPEDVKEHIFEPFFTTKERGSGTGLGLATVYGIVTRSGGTIRADSVPNSGTTFEIYLPRHKGAIPAHVVTENGVIAEGANETILVVEDEPAIRRMLERVLTRRGYKVLTAETSKASLELAAQYDDPIHLLLSDVVMPELSGPEVAEVVLMLHPEARLLFMSGYPADILATHGISDAEDYLLKPFSTDGLLERSAQPCRV